MHGNSAQRLWTPPMMATLALLTLSVVFGGASRDHALRIALVELAALPVLVMSGVRLLRNSEWREHRFALGVAAAMLALPLLQLVPLPASIWTGLPGREQLVLGRELTGLAPGWSAMSLNPDATWRSFLALLPPVAMLLTVLTLSYEQRLKLIYFSIAAAIAAVVLGAAQLVSGGEQLYPWTTTDAGSVVGFFANRNHLASYLLITVPFAVVIAAATIRRRSHQAAGLWLGGLFVGLVIVGLAAIRSRAGITLFAPVMLASALAAWIATGRGAPKVWLLGLAGVVAAAFTAIAVLALPPILERFDTQENPELRFERWPLVAETAQNFLPVGSGIGSFDAVYRSVEPLDQLDATYFNQAHNDYLETWLEAGWFGGAILIAFMVWFARRTWVAWRGRASREQDLQRAASIGIGVLLLHSVADYPLRTATLAVMFALCCGILELASRPQRDR